jgi:hypothetical protein
MGVVSVDMQAKEIPVNLRTMKAEIDASDNTVVYIVENGIVQAIPLPAFGVLEIPCQNYKIGNPSYKITLKRK